MGRGHCNQAAKTHESSQDVSRARSALGVRGPWGRQPPRVGSRKEHPREAQGTSLRTFLEEPGPGTARDKTPITLEAS